MKKPKHIHFHCLKCDKDNWLPATPYLINYYEDVETSYCPVCDDEELCEVQIYKLTTTK